MILLDEKGKEFTSTEFANFLQKKLNSVTTNLVFVIGGAFGFSPAVYERGNDKLALAKMTFSHQMVRLFLSSSFTGALPFCAAKNTTTIKVATASTEKTQRPEVMLPAFVFFAQLVFFMRLFSFLVRFVNGARRVVGRGINAVEFQVGFAGVFNIMVVAGRNEE